MTTTGTDRCGGLRLAAMLAVALFALAVAVASVADTAGAQSKSHNKGKGSTETFGGESEHRIGETSTAKVKFNAKGVPVKVTKLDLNGFSECLAVQSTTEWKHSAPIPVKAEKSRRGVTRSFRKALSGPAGSGTVEGKLDDEGRMMSITLHLVFEKPGAPYGIPGELECTLNDGFDLAREGGTRGHGGKTRGHDGGSHDPKDHGPKDHGPRSHDPGSRHPGTPDGLGHLPPHH